ncbi:hypothetical protein N9D57_03835 [bacterium]|nr:hypothetical protein [bacterium]
MDGGPEIAPGGKGGGEGGGRGGGDGGEGGGGQGCLLHGLLSLYE